MRTLKQLMAAKNYGGVSLDEIDFNSETEEQIKEFASFIKTRPKLTFVSFYGNSKINKISLFNWEKAQPILDAIAENINIQNLSFGRCCFEEISIEQVHILQEFIKKSYIKKVLFEDDSIQKPCPALDFIISISSMPVEHLYCDTLGFGKKDFAVINKLKVLSTGNLISLALRSNFIGNHNAQKLGNDSYADVLIALFSGKLKSIDLSHNLLGLSTATNVNDWKNIFKAIDENKILQTLNLSSCGLHILINDDEDENDEFVVMLENFLQNTALREINLTGNQFWQDTSKRILKAALQNPTLVLKLDKTGLSEGEIKELKESIMKELSEQMKPREQEHKEIHDTPSSAKPLILSNGINGANSQSGINNPQNPDSLNKNKFKK